MRTRVMAVARIKNEDRDAFEAAFAEVTEKVKAGREDELERTWRKIADRVRQEPDNIRQALLRDPDDRSSFVITSDWETRDAFTRFERSEQQDELTAPLRDLRESASITLHEIVEIVEAVDRT